MIPEALQKVIDALGSLPGVGARTAERYGYFLLKSEPTVANRLGESLAQLHEEVAFCPKTFALIDRSQTVSPLYDDPNRDKTTVIVVEEPLDIISLENTHSFNGTYHVLGGAISPLSGITPDELHFGELLDRIADDGVREIIIATNASVEGESTAIFLTNFLREQIGSDLRITRLARGIPIGADLGYTDSMTLTHALTGRQIL
ncbi:MAG: recombination mediator RecR [Candidatus Nomurabacteria bacterium]|jgi:recombination protein RecR|nr:recombination mediator RecR [Candidatus Nomurabacteria bacterium]